MVGIESTIHFFYFNFPNPVKNLIEIYFPFMNNRFSHFQKDIDEKFIERKRQLLAEQEAWEEEQGVGLEAPSRERARERSKEKDNKSRDRDRDRDREAR